MTEHAADTLARLEIDQRLINSRIEQVSETLRKNHRDRVGASYYAYPDPVTGKMRAYPLPPTEAIAEAVDGGASVYIDTETTGLRVFEGARPIVIAIVDATGSTLGEGRPSKEASEIYGQPHPISTQAAAVNGYDQERIDALEPWSAQDGIVIERALYDAAYVVGHNVWFDLGMISAMLDETVGNTIEIDPARVIDTQVIYGALYPGEKSSLDACLSRFGLTRSGDEHNALEDAKLTKRLLACLYQEMFARNIGDA